jgi:hypothetical protein
MEPEGSLQHSQAPATCPYPEPAQSSPDKILGGPYHVWMGHIMSGWAISCLGGPYHAGWAISCLDALKERGGAFCPRWGPNRVCLVGHLVNHTPPQLQHDLVGFHTWKCGASAVGQDIHFHNGFTVCSDTTACLYGPTRNH